MFSFYKDNHIRAFRILNNHRISPVHLIVISSADRKLSQWHADAADSTDYCGFFSSCLSNCPTVQLPYSIYVVYLNHFHKFILIFIPIIST